MTTTETVQFQYSSIGRPLLAELEDVVGNGHSIVVLGPRHGGKGMLLECLAEGLVAAGITPVIPQNRPVGVTSKLAS